jgi:hypothetical protein
MKNFWNWKTYKRKLIEFVIEKGKIIASTECPTAYVNDEDIKEIESWNDTKCATIYKQLRKNVDGSFCQGLYIDNCIWCLKNVGSCNECGWGKRHGFCADINSDFIKIKDFDSNWDRILTRDVYKSIIKKIERAK